MTIVAVLFAVLGGCLLIGVPISYSIGVAALAGLHFGGVPFAFLTQSSFTSLDNFTTIAVPFFILAGAVMETGGLSKRLINVAQSIVGNVTGGIGIVTVLACAFFAAISGSSPATVAAIGSIMIPAMVARGYSVPFAASITACAGGLGIIIPPSINMIIYAIAANISISDMFTAGFIPGGIMVACFSLYIHFSSKKKGYQGTGERFNLKKFLDTLWEAKWALLAPVIILGGIYSGWFTPTESAAIAVVYGMIVGLFVYKELKFEDIGRVFVESAVTTGAVVIILATATAFGRLVSMYQIPQMVGEFLIGISESWVVVLLFIALLLFILGMFMETLSVMIILTPILLPLVKSLGVDPIHFGMIMVVGAQIGMITPPVGVNLFVASGISGLSLEKMSRGIVPFVVLLTAIYILIILIPQISTFLPHIFS